MKIQTLLALLSMVGMIVYSVYAVRHKNDRRRVPKDMLHALYSVAAMALVIISASAVLDVVIGVHPHVSKWVTEYGMVCAAGSVVVALRILKGAPYDRR